MGKFMLRCNIERALGHGVTTCVAIWLRMGARQCSVAAIEMERTRQ
jgi:hypothetical protein